MNEENVTSKFFALRQRLRRMAKRLLGSGDDADDALQDIFVKLWSRPELIQGDMSESFLAAMVRNQCIDTLRKKMSHGIEVDVDELREVVSVNDTAEANELYDDVQSIINAELSDLQREILILHDMEEIEYDDIATRLNMSVNAVRLNVSRARNTIRTIYRERKITNNKLK